MSSAQTPTPTEIQKTLGLQHKGKWHKKRWIWLGGLALILAAGGAYYYTLPQEDPALAYRTEVAKNAQIVATISATGTVQPLNQIEVSSEVSGTVREVRVQENDHVNQGDVLVVLDQTRLQASRERALAQIAAAESRQAQAAATVKQSERDLVRQNRLRVGGLASDQAQESAAAVEERAQAALLAAIADVKSAKADLAQVDVDMTKSIITAPISGMVLKTSVKMGQAVVPAQSGSGLVTLVEDLAKVRIEAAVDESDIGQVKLGQEANFKVDAFRDKTFSGKVDAISYFPDVVDGVVTYKTSIKVLNEELLLRPGMTAPSKITIAKLSDVLSVPNEALRYTLKKTEARKFSLFIRMGRPSPDRKPVIAEDGSREINVLRGGKPVTLSIKTGITDGKMTQVLSDQIKVGDAVIVGQAR